ncbi:MAG: transcription termination/antitermination protein NusG [Prevotella sp.]|nr:transcription termination/antitermination protein NusG [Prevotella sp.]MDD7272974.1 transcription termination/antitermination protein NusG [Prevotellaceae bacterium]MDY3935078.1 transcription termination/antitermination protein NusG [Prevotella sp.]MDY4217280.1 transcription termination/antitermination protein NusG [Prevotella sp.]
MAELEKKWYVLRAISGKEAKVKEYIEAELRQNEKLAANVYEVLLPKESYATSRNGKRVITEKLSLPGYVLVQASMNAETASTLRFMPNVLGFLGGMSNPSPVRQAEVNRLLGNVEESELEEFQEVLYTVGETVKVTDGPFSGFHGIIDEVSPEKHKLKVMVMIFGRQNPLELSFAQVAKEE